MERLDPALRAAGLARIDLSAQLLAPARESLDQRRRAMAEHLDTAGVVISSGEAVARDGRAVPVRIYRGGPSPSPAIVYCHAGAFVLGNLDIDHRQCVELARRAGATVEYRLAPEHPYPAALEDVHAVLAWVVANAARVDIDATRVAVAGSSAGGALAACLAQRSADGALPPLMLQVLHQPVLDDRPTPSKAEFSAIPSFGGHAAEQMWRHYLADTAPSAAAVPARRTRLAGLPPALITCAEIDPLRDEALEYGMGLLRAGVPTELHLFAGACHGFDSLLPDWSTTERLFGLQGDVLRRALHGAQA